MKKLLALIAFLLWAAPASAQPPVFCPTRPPGDNTNACASTAFVIANGGGGGGVSSVALTMPGIFSVAGSPITTSGTLAVTANGNSGGIPYFNTATTLTSSSVLTLNAPILGGGAGGGPQPGSRSGNTTVFGTVSGSLTSGNCIKSDASGNLIDATTTCGGGGSGTVTSIATTSPITGGTITTTGTIACATCVTSAAALTNNAIVIGGGLQATSTTTTGTGVLTALGVNTGSAGAFVVNGGALGIPSSGTLTNATGLPIGGVTGLGTGIATWLATPSGANLTSALTSPLTVAGGGSGAATLGSGLPLFGAGTSAITTGTLSGNTTKLATTTGTLTSGNCVQIDASGNFVQASGTCASSSTDPCQAVTKTYTPISITTATTTRIIAPTSAKKTYICHIVLTAAAADNVGIVEGTGGTCGTGTAGVVGGTTSASGPSFAANGGLAAGNGISAVWATAGTNVDFCLITSAAVQLSGMVAWVQQ